MAQITITNSVTGIVNNERRSFVSSQVKRIRSANDSSFLVSNSWALITNASGPSAQTIILINSGQEDALYRIGTGVDYSRFTLPAGAAVVLYLNNLLPLGTEQSSPSLPNEYRIHVYSANGTTIRAIVAA